MTPQATITDEWIARTLSSLYAHHRFIPDDEPFLLDPDVFDSVGGYRDQVMFLITRHRLPYRDVNVYMHADLTSEGRHVAGLARYPTAFDVSGLDMTETLLSVERDGTQSTLDLSDPRQPVIRRHRQSIRQTPQSAAIFLNQAYVGHKELLAAIIAHEVAHLYLYHRGVHVPTLGLRDPMIEYETDIAMFVLGLGLLVLRSPYGTGYLSQQQAVFTHKQVLVLEGDLKSNGCM